MDKSNCQLAKVFTVKTSTGNTYYVQRMDMPYRGIIFRVMKNRNKLFYTDYTSLRSAVQHLIKYLDNEYNQQELPI